MPSILNPIPSPRERASAQIKSDAEHLADRAEKVTAAVSAPRRLLSLLTSEQRKQYPIVTGVFDYFPDAIAEVAHVSYLGNEKHNPGQPMHWARGKSMDHENCIARHTIERDTVESVGTDEVLHAAYRAWRSLAALQELLEQRHKLDAPRGCW